jgi:RimJ/RimL family protein N-acetyltransferase
MQFFDKTYTREEARAWIVKQQARYAADGHGYWIVEDKSTKQRVGQAGLLRIDLDGVSEIALGYLTHQPFWRQGYATEAGGACRDYVFERLTVLRLVCPIRPENRTSQRVALRIGMKPRRLAVFAGFEHLIFVMHRTSPANPDADAQSRMES